MVETDLGEEQQVVDFKPNQKSRRYAVPDRVSEISFRREVDQGDGDPIEIEVAAVRFADGQQRALFVFFETSDFAASQQYEVLELDESPDVWSAGCFRFLNLSGSELNCRMGSRELALPLDASEIIRFDPDSQGVMPFRLSVIWMGVERTVLSMRMAPDPNHPKLFVIKPPLEEGSLRVRLDTLW